MEEPNDQAPSSLLWEAILEDKQNIASNVNSNLPSYDVNAEIDRFADWAAATSVLVKAECLDDPALSAYDDISDKQNHFRSTEKLREGSPIPRDSPLMKRECEDVLAGREQAENLVPGFTDFENDFRDERAERSPLRRPLVSEVPEHEQHPPEYTFDLDVDDIGDFDFEPPHFHTEIFDWIYSCEAEGVTAQSTAMKPFQQRSLGNSELDRSAQLVTTLQEDIKCTPPSLASSSHNAAAEIVAPVIASSSAQVDSVLHLGRALIQRQPQDKNSQDSDHFNSLSNSAPILNVEGRASTTSGAGKGVKQRVAEAEAERQVWIQERDEVFKEYQNIQGPKWGFGAYLANIVRRQLAVKRAPRPGVMTRSAAHPPFKIKVSEFDFLWELRQLNFDPNREDTIDMEVPTVGRDLDGPWLRTFEKYCFATYHVAKVKPTRSCRDSAVHWHRGRMYTLRAEKGVPKEAVFLSDVHKLVEVSQDNEGRSYDSPWRFRRQAGDETFQSTPKGLAYLRKHRYWNPRNAGQHSPAIKCRRNPSPPKQQSDQARDLLQDPLGRFYLDADGETIVDHPGLPLTIPYDVEDWRIRAMIANGVAVSRKDIMARMPCKGRSGVENTELGNAIHPLVIKALPWPTDQRYCQTSQAHSQVRRDHTDCQTATKPSGRCGSQAMTGPCHSTKDLTNFEGKSRKYPWSNSGLKRKRMLREDDGLQVTQNEQMSVDK